MAQDFHSGRMPPRAPRVLVLQPSGGPGRPPASRQPGWLAPAVEARMVGVPRVLRGGRTARACHRALHRDGFEMVHLADARLAPLGASLRRRLGVPVSADVSAQDAGVLRSTSVVRALQCLDQLFASDELSAADLRVRGIRVPATIVPPAAMVLPKPSERALGSVGRSLRGVAPGRLVVGLPWPRAATELRWFRDAVLPRLASSPVCLLFGVADRREARRIVSIVGGPEFRVHGGALDAAAIAAVGSCVDAFVTASAGTWEDGGIAVLLSMAVSGAPVVAAGGDAAAVLYDERNAFLAGRGDDAAFVSTLDRLLALPAAQRHTLGDEFARYTLDRWPSAAAAEVYAERFSTLVGRPPIPGELRAA